MGEKLMWIIAGFGTVALLGSFWRMHLVLAHSTSALLESSLLAPSLPYLRSKAEKQ